MHFSARMTTGLRCRDALRRGRHAPPAPLLYIRFMDHTRLRCRTLSAPHPRLRAAPPGSTGQDSGGLYFTYCWRDGLDGGAFLPSQLARTAITHSGTIVLTFNKGHGPCLLCVVHTHYLPTQC